MTAYILHTCSTGLHNIRLPQCCSMSSSWVSLVVIIYVRRDGAWVGLLSCFAGGNTR